VQLSSVSHTLRFNFAETLVKNVKSDTIWQPTLQQARRQDLATMGVKNEKEGPKTRKGATF